MKIKYTSEYVMSVVIRIIHVNDIYVDLSKIGVILAPTFFVNVTQKQQYVSPYNGISSKKDVNPPCTLRPFTTKRTISQMIACFVLMNYKMT